MSDQGLKICRLVVVMVVAISSVASAQQQPPVRSAGGGFNEGPIVPVGMSTPARWNDRINIASSEKQIRVNIRYVMLDVETRRAIYKRLGTDAVKTVGNKVPKVQPLPNNHANAAGREYLLKSSHVTTAVLDKEELQDILEDVSKTASSTITRVPSVILVSGQQAEVTDLVQRPFLVDLQRQKNDKGEALLDTITQVLDEGTSVSLKATITPSERIHLNSEIKISKITGVETEEVFGIAETETKLQVPIQQQKVVMATENLELGQTLMIDPYVKHTQTRTIETATPLSGLPFVGDAFKNKQRATINQQLVVLLTPIVERDLKPRQLP